MVELGANPMMSLNLKKLLLTLTILSALTAVAAAQAAQPTSTSSKDSAAEVHYFRSTEIAAAFAKGATILKGSNFVVMTASRDKPGEVEVHTRFRDVIYIVQGEATIVVGGKIAGPKPVTNPEEPRGASIEGGETHQLSAGDVIVIPAGVPHWMNKVSAPFHYFVVKVEEAGQ